MDFYENDGYSSRMMACEKRIEKKDSLSKPHLYIFYLQKLTKPTEIYQTGINNVVYSIAFVPDTF